jgi:hypothetical protein
MFRFTIRELLILTVTAGLAVGSWLDRRADDLRTIKLQRDRIALQRERDVLFAKLETTANKEQMLRQEAQTWESLTKYREDERGYWMNKAQKLEEQIHRTAQLSNPKQPSPLPDP